MVSLLASGSTSGFGFGLLVAAFWFGFRHGIDWDHIAAITDITSSQEERSRALKFGTLYAVGHALVVLLLGVLAIAAGENLPSGVDEVMTRIVGATLILLGVYVVVSLVRHGRDFRMRSRWMLIFAGIRKGVRWIRRRRESGASQWMGAPGRGHAADAVEGEVQGARGTSVATVTEAASWHHGHHGRPGHHHHNEPEVDDPFITYGGKTAFGVGMIHGVGAETPTQVLIFISAAGAGGTLVGILVLLAFIVGLLMSNTLITLGTAFGFLRASRNFGIYATVAILTAVFSLVIGTLFLLGESTLLPALFGG